SICHVANRLPADTDARGGPRSLAPPFSRPSSRPRACRDTSRVGASKDAIRLREKGLAEEVVVVGIGPADLTAHLRNGLAMGANRAIHVSTAEAVQPLTA